LQQALTEEGKAHGLTQSDIARALGVHRSVISRQLTGRENLTIARVGELAEALNRDAEFKLVKRTPSPGDNQAPPPPGTTGGLELPVTPQPQSMTSKAT
jgi:transcriptional regulator with XRE-family HTH domain